MAHAHAPGQARHDHDHDHGPGGHSHAHGVVDPSIATSERGLQAVKWSGIALFAIALLELVIFALSRSTALMADRIHTCGDAFTVVPLGIACAIARRAPGRGFSFGYGRAEDLAGIAVVIALVINALLAGYEALHRLFHPEPIQYLGAVAAASIISFVGNEGIAIMRIRVGREIGSAALVADGHHARVDGWTALAVLVGAVGVRLGYPIADPVMGLVITVAILGVVWASAKTIFSRMLDAVDPRVLEELRATACAVAGVREVSEVRARWAGHRLFAEMNVAVDPTLSVSEGHAIAASVQHQLLHHASHVGAAVIHICPAGEHGADFHGHGVGSAGCAECPPS
ncbi:MAG: cation diffusion facilitator family transporter [Gemmatimonadaceae bacterium]